MKTEILGDRYHYETFGDPSGQPVIFLHGFSQSSATWHPVRDALLGDPAGAGLRLVFLDLIGHGESDKPADDGPYAMVHVIDSLEGFRRELGAGRVHLVGYSMGGRIALAHAVRYPDALRSLVLESASFGPRTRAEREAMLERDRALAEKLLRSTPEEFAEWWDETPVLTSQRELPAALRRAEGTMRRANDMAALARAVLGGGQGAMKDLRDAASGLPVPALYLVGRKDERYSTIAAEAQSEWGLDVRRFPTGHNVHLEMPEEYARTLLGFFARTPWSERSR
ncbi:MAG: alpha/beta fold hydrolase [Coriobacteriia bacterium]|nr:alpha/beta fold hydrolase [Coriobacteriia bacterium]